MPKRVLIIHPIAGIRKRIAKGLKRCGWQLYEAENRLDGLPLLFTVQPHLVCLDINGMEDQNWETISIIRFFSDVPVVLLANQTFQSIDNSLAKKNTAMLTPPYYVTRIISLAKILWKADCNPPAISFTPKYPVPRPSAEKSHRVGKPS